MIWLTEIWFKGCIFFAITQCLKQFTYVSRHFKVQNRKKLIYLRKTVLKIWFQKFTKNNYCCPYKLPNIINAFMVFTFKWFLVFELFLKVVLWIHRLLSHKSETTFSKQFLLNNFCLFSILNSRMYKKHV